MIDFPDSKNPGVAISVHFEYCNCGESMTYINENFNVNHHLFSQLSSNWRPTNVYDRAAAIDQAPLAAKK